MGLRDRVQRLERRIGRGNCEVCGWGNPARVRLQFRWPHESATQSTPWTCSTCGRAYPIQVTLEWPQEIGDGGVEKG